MRRLAFFIIPVLIAGTAVAKDEVLYKSPNKIDEIKVVRATKTEKEGGLKHPYEMGPEQIRSILRSLKFSKRSLLMKDIENRELFTEANVEFLAPYLIDGLKKATLDQVVAVSYFSRESKFGITNDRLNTFRVFVKEDGLHFRFGKLYAKLLGDRTTQGAERAMNNAQEIRVQLEPQPGQALISIKPAEVLFDLSYFLPDGKVAAPEKPQKPLAHTHEKGKEEVAPAQKSVRERLKELDRLKEEELITEKEYQKKRNELIEQL